MWQKDKAGERGELPHGTSHNESGAMFREDDEWTDAEERGDNALRNLMALRAQESRRYIQATVGVGTWRNLLRPPQARDASGRGYAVVVAVAPDMRTFLEAVTVMYLSPKVADFIFRRHRADSDVFRLFDVAMMETFDYRHFSPDTYEAGMVIDSPHAFAEDDRGNEWYCVVIDGVSCAGATQEDVDYLERIGCTIEFAIGVEEPRPALLVDDRGRRLRFTDDQWWSDEE